jgi:hypothetical protein
VFEYLRDGRNCNLTLRTNGPVKLRSVVAYRRSNYNRRLLQHDWAGHIRKLMEDSTNFALEQNMSTDKLRYQLLLSVTCVDLSGYVPAPFIIKFEHVANKLGNLCCSPTTDLQHPPLLSHYSLL